MLKQLKSPFIPGLLLTALVWLAFSRTLSTYFLADDFGEITYVSKIAAGDFGLLLSNFTGNYMQVPGMSVWRPWLLISILGDFLVWRANPVGYYLTNLICYNLSVVLLYYFLLKLCRDFDDCKRALACFLAAALFALSPLHCESISWMVGRVDILCSVLYLASLLLYMKAEEVDADGGKPLKIITFATTAFWLAMWTKEMAIGIPVLVPVLYFLFGHGERSCSRMLRLCLPLWISTVVYFILRYLALGTILGGYTQGIGDAQASHALSRWLDVDTLRRLFLPFAYGIFGDHHIFQTLLFVLYLILTGLLIARLLCFKPPVKLLLFLPVWIATTLAPIYKLWGLGYELEGARFCYFLTMPLSACLPLLLLSPTGKITARALQTVSTALIGAMAVIMGKVAVHSNLEWVHAGKEVREFLNKAWLRGVAQNSQETQIILGIPKRRGGAHMILNGVTFQMALGKPFRNETIPEGKFITFDPIIFGDHNHIDSERLKRILCASPIARASIWDSEKQNFRELTYAHTTIPKLSLAQSDLQCRGFLHTIGGAMQESTAQGMHIYNIKEGDSLAFSKLAMSPLGADFLEVKLKSKCGGKLRATWIGANENTSSEKLGERTVESDPLEKDKEQTIRLRLSSNWHWYENSSIDSVFLLLPPGDDLTIEDVRLVSAAEVSPMLGTAHSPSSTGVYSIDKNNQPKLDFWTRGLCDLSGDSEIALDITKPNAFLENVSPAEEAQVIQETIKFPLPAGVTHTELAIPSEKLADGALHQLRARILKNGKARGEASEAIVLQLR